MALAGTPNINIYICGECKCKVTYFKCNLNLPKNIKKKYIFILNRVLKPTTLYMWTFDISLFLYEKKGQIIQLLLNNSLFYFPEIKSKYRSENSIYRIFNSFMRTPKNRPQRHFQTKYTYNQCQRRKYRCLDRHIQLNKMDCWKIKSV